MVKTEIENEKLTYVVSQVKTEKNEVDCASLCFKIQIFF